MDHGNALVVTNEIAHALSIANEESKDVWVFFLNYGCTFHMTSNR